MHHENISARYIYSCIDRYIYHQRHIITSRYGDGRVDMKKIGVIELPKLACAIELPKIEMQKIGKPFEVGKGKFEVKLPKIKLD